LQKIKTKLGRSIGPLFGLLLFMAALWVLHHELQAYQLNDIVRHFEEIPDRRIFLALALTFISYFVMTGYDVLALRYIRHPLPFGKTALASFIGYAFSNNIGLSMIAGASVRYRLYSAWGLSTLKITKVVAFCSLTLWLGFFTISGLTFIFKPISIPEVLHLPFTSVRTLGAVLLAVVGAYLLLSVLRKRPLTIREWEFPLPSVGLLIAQSTIASLDWIVAGGVLYSLMPPLPAFTFIQFIGIYLLAQLAGLLSQVPGGLGVFETTALLFLSPYMPASEILSVLLVYRAIYYLLPLGAATALLGGQEILQNREKVHRFIITFSQWVSGLVPHVLSFAVFVAGAILLFSGTTPEGSWRLMQLEKFLPLPVLEISHFLGSLAGMGLLILSRGLQRRLDAAYVFTIVLLASGAVFSLLKGLDYEDAVILLVMLAVLLSCRRHFYRKASIFSQSFDTEWIVLLAIVLICSVWLGMFSYKHVEYSGDLWWHFTFFGNASRFLRAMAGATGVILFFSMAKLFRPAIPKTALTRKDDLDKAIPIVRQSLKAYANLALLGDKSFLFSENMNAFIMYGVEARSWIGMGDPIGPEEQWPELIWRFREICDHYDGHLVFYKVGSEKLFLYLDLGLTLLKLGEEALVELKPFSLNGSIRKGLRYTVRKLEKTGCVFEIIPREALPHLLPELKHISNVWLNDKNTREKGFSLGSFNQDYLKQFPVGIVKKDDKIVAFANIWAGAERKELSIDLMRHLPDAPHGVMEYLFVQLMLWGGKEGYQWFNLGMAPLSGLKDHTFAPLWNRLGAFAFRHGEHFYNLQGLRQYKEKFKPQWDAKYIACPGGLALPRILANIASLVSGGVKGIIAR